MREGGGDDKFFFFPEGGWLDWKGKKINKNSVTHRCECAARDDDVEAQRGEVRRHRSADTGASTRDERRRGLGVACEC